jgi:hypothetical protein
MATDQRVGAALGTYLDVVDEAAPGFVEGLYVVGSVALGDWIDGSSDIDVVVVTAEPPTDDDAAVLRTVHAVLSERQPLPHIDGPYVAWADLTISPTTGLHRPYTLQGELHHDGECFEINPITWYTLAAHGRTARGPAPSKLGVWTSVDERIRFVVDNLAGYWTDTAAAVEAACADADARFDRESFVWCALGALRLHHTAFTGEVISKTAAGHYGLEVGPAELHPALELALDWRSAPVDDDAAAGAGVDAATMAGSAAVIRWVTDEVHRASAAPGR